jgi:hypothetical protein
MPRKQISHAKRKFRVNKPGGGRGVPRALLLCSLHGASSSSSIRAACIHVSLQRLSKRRQARYVRLPHPRAGRHLRAIRRQRFPGHSRARERPKTVMQTTQHHAHRPRGVRGGRVRCEHSRHVQVRLRLQVHRHAMRQGLPMVRHAQRASAVVRPSHGVASHAHDCRLS